MDGAAIDWQSWSNGDVRCDEDIVLAGHSFGGATVVSRQFLHLELIC
jgi:hypothetical protein